MPLAVHGLGRINYNKKARLRGLRLMKNPSIFGSSQKRGVLIPICSRFESVTFRESEAILTLPEVCQQSEPACAGFLGCFWTLVVV
ncbi:hypothetical protein B3286c2_0573 [Brucella vulpis]|nr:hypothetical protein BF3285c2_0578 [Brucella vulpis]CUW51590.1 hypothetical protein B3286c2_0573 [Brucella vulpis]